MKELDTYYQELLANLTTYFWNDRIYLYSSWNEVIFLEFEVEDQTLRCYGFFRCNSEIIQKHLQEIYDWKVKKVYFHAGGFILKDLFNLKYISRI